METAPISSMTAIINNFKEQEQEDCSQTDLAVKHAGDPNYDPNNGDNQ